jgi:hypothetical protein
MPFYNLFHSGERLLPIENNDEDIALRVWFNLGTSVERVITISMDSSKNYSGLLIEYGTLYKKRFFRKGYRKSNEFFRKNEIVPKSGFENFFDLLNNLQVLNYESQKSFELITDHKPFSLFVIEYKNKENYNQFKFYPMNSSENEYKIYKEIDDFIKEELLYNLRIN